MYYFAELIVKSNKKIYDIAGKVSAIFMVLALLWLTISAPFVFSAQQEIAKQNKSANANSPFSGNDEETTNPFGNNTEEKASSSNSVSEEYLHDSHVMDHFFSIARQYHKCKNAGTYIAFHGELLVPPPNAA
jgi:hypothetical protein